MSNHIHLYKNNPTAGLMDGVEISSGDNTSPLNIILNATQGEEKALKVAIRCEPRYVVNGGTSIYFEGTNASKWRVAEDNNYTDADHALNMGVWANSITLGGVSATNQVFWVKAMSISGESPQNDRTVSLVAEGLVAATE